MKNLIFAGITGVFFALIFTIGGFTSKDKKDRETAKFYFVVVWLISMALWIYGNAQMSNGL